MAKRKAAVNDIIYELDNDDIEISDEEVTQPKINRLDENNSPATTQSDSNTQSSCLEVIEIDSSTEKFVDILSPSTLNNGGKISEEFIIIDETSDTASPKPVIEVDRRRKVNSDTIYNEDIIVDSPASNSDPGVVGCENRTPLVTVRFRDNKLAMNYKKKIKAFMLNLIRLHENNTETDDDTDLELDIWPEDLSEVDHPEPENPEHNLFFIDTDPSMDIPKEIPRYSQNLSMISDVTDIEPTPSPMFKKGPICFNCEGSHALRDCTLPRNNMRIAERRKAMQKMGRYHIEDEQKYGHLVPGRISGELRHALGLKRHQLPLHIYLMRRLGYPPGWLEEARISHSGITLFDSSGQATLEPDEEEGEVCEPGSKDKFDIKKILDFPGFNVPSSSRYKDEAHNLCLPLMSEQDSKMAMLQVLAPNAMKAYKRKKLTFFPSASDGAPSAGLAEMDIDSGDEVADFPSQPPLPDDAPPPPPPPPELPPPPLPESSPIEKPKEPSASTTAKPSEPSSSTTEKPKEPSASTTGKPNEPSSSTTGKPNEPSSSTVEKRKDTPAKVTKDKTESDDDIEVVEVIKVGDIPVPVLDLITIDVDGEISEPENGPTSPSLDDLEQKKKLLLDALQTDQTSDLIVIEESEEVSNVTKADDVANIVEKESPKSVEDIVEEVPTQVESLNQGNIENEAKTDSDSDVNETPNAKTGQVTATHYGTPVINIASPYDKLPSDDKFAKDICDVINFENLPNSTGKYKKISTLLKKVKSQVDRIQES